MKPVTAGAASGRRTSISSNANWNRLWAIIWDGPQGAPDESLAYWAKYIEDLKTVSVFNATERALAQAMVWNCMAGQHRDLAADLCDGDGPFGLPAFREDSTEVKRARKKVIECLNQSLKLAPQHLPTYKMLVEAYRGWDDSANLESAAQRLLARFPEDLDTLGVDLGNGDGRRLEGAAEAGIALR